MTSRWWVAVCCILAGCAHTPNVKLQGRSVAEYEADHADCERLDQEKHPPGATLPGRVVGAALGAAFGVMGSGGAPGAARGAIAGLGSPRDDLRVEFEQCLARRGYGASATYYAYEAVCAEVKQLCDDYRLTPRQLWKLKVNLEAQFGDATCLEPCELR